MGISNEEPTGVDLMLLIGMPLAIVLILAGVSYFSMQMDIPGERAPAASSAE